MGVRDESVGNIQTEITVIVKFYEANRQCIIEVDKDK